MRLPRAVYTPTARTPRAIGWLRFNVWVVGALVWSMFVVRQCWQERPEVRFVCGGHVWQRTYQVSLSLDQRCELVDDSVEAEALEERVSSEFAAACGYRAYVGFLTPHCVRGNSHWVSCDGGVESLPYEESERSRLVAIALDQRARAHVAEQGGGERLPQKVTDISESMLQAALAFRRAGSREWLVTVDELVLRTWLDRQCIQQGAERVLVRDLDTYRGPPPDSIYCDRIENFDGSVFVLDRTTRTWQQR